MTRPHGFDHQQVVTLHREGRTVTEIARQLGISRHSVKRVVVPGFRQRDNERRNRHQRANACAYCGDVCTTKATYCLEHRFPRSRQENPPPLKKRKRRLGNGVPLFNGSADVVGVRTRDLVRVLDEWYRSSEAYWTVLAERAGYRDSRSVYKVRSCSSEFTSMTVADRLLTALGKAAMLTDGTLEIIRNPRHRP